MKYPIRSNVTSGMYPSYTDMFKASELREAQFSVPYNFPLFASANVVPRKLIPFDKITKTKEEDFDAFVHFYLPDVCFERFWKNPTKYIPILKKFAGCILPDFSLCYDFPYPLQLYNCYKNRVLGYILAKNEIPVIMNVSFADSRTYDFCCNGIPHGNIIATGSLGTIKNPENREYFTRGLIFILDKLKPRDLIIYGSVTEEIRNICSLKGVGLHVFSPTWDSSFVTTEAIYG
ncbi:MAG: DUF4417 domain-containing protein [Sphaerochaetaceae bacterium]|nr:DUF4417 domain-containing protein [Sphaerochaetaceae bacterium]